MGEVVVSGQQCPLFIGNIFRYDSGMNISDVSGVSWYTSAEFREFYRIPYYLPELVLAANVLVRIMNAHTVALRNFYKVSYCCGQDNRKNNVKVISLQLLTESKAPPSDNSDENDMSDICGHIEPTAQTEPAEEG